MPKVTIWLCSQLVRVTFEVCASCPVPGLGIHTPSHFIAWLILVSKSLRTAQLVVKSDGRKLGEVSTEKGGDRPEEVCA